MGWTSQPVKFGSVGLIKGSWAWCLIVVTCSFGKPMIGYVFVWFSACSFSRHFFCKGIRGKGKIQGKYFSIQRLPFWGWVLASYLGNAILETSRELVCHLPTNSLANPLTLGSQSGVTKEGKKYQENCHSWNICGFWFRFSLEATHWPGQAARGSRQHQAPLGRVEKGL